LARSEQRTAAAQRHAEDLLKSTGQPNDKADRSECGMAWTPSSVSTWHTIDATLFQRSDPGSAAPGEPILWAKTRIPKAHVLYRAGDRTEALYAVRFGSCKTELLSKNGQEQVVGFYMVGDVIGADGIASEVHTCQATALEDTEVLRLPLDSLEEIARHDPSFGPDFHKLLSQETARAHALMLVLGLMRAEQRLAFFLVDLSQRYQARGYSSCEYVLRMSRQEIGSYLGLKLETVSRLFSRFHREGVVQIDGRNIVLRDRPALIQRAEGG
ncbi:MAG TPA: helix-turn-helix domain-containing protein, partial [Burkholderiaceae bacterium]|nr:helix-turn-helix domain-containing protein [Burkholderiaceae bacterium]